MTLEEIAQQIEAARENVILMFAFNATGKTRLSVAYKNLTKDDDGKHAGVYFNAFSEDLFYWENDEENSNASMKLHVRHSSLSQFHSNISEGDIEEKLKAYRPRYDFRFTSHTDVEKGIDFVEFSEKDGDTPIKISRGEERIFIWCFFLTLLDVEGWADVQSSHFFIDDPVTSLDDHNLFTTSFTISDLIENHYQDRKIIIATHHVGLFAILFDFLFKGEKASRYKRIAKAYILTDQNGGLVLESCDSDVFLYHLRLLQLLNRARDADEVKAHHLVLLRQLLENVASFLGTGRIGHVLTHIGVDDEDNVARMLNALSHKNIYRYESDSLVKDNREMFEEILDKLQDKFSFVTHA